MIVDLVWFSDTNCDPAWTCGKVHVLPPSAGDVSACVQAHLAASKADAWLFWDSQLGSPPLALIKDLLNTSEDVWHSGLALGTAGQPDFIDFVSPTWMLNRDPDRHIEATSWRASLRCCLVRMEVLRQMGGPLAAFSTLDAAGLEMGFRYIRGGVFVRQIPALIEGHGQAEPVKIPLDDQLRFIQAGFGKKWLYWAAVRAVLSRKSSLPRVLAGLRSLQHASQPGSVRPYQHVLPAAPAAAHAARVSVLIPTVNRYPYLRTLLGQLRNQTIPPFEILVIDQTPEAERDHQLKQDFFDLPMCWFELDQAGQCSSRNLGLQQAKGEYILFIDDDDEIPTSLIEDQLGNMQQQSCRVSNGIAHEVGIPKLPHGFSFLRTSDVFPTNNSMIKKDVLQNSGLFDLAYDRGQRADGDLGMRIYLSGERMVLNPEITVLHHHAPQGGLRQHKARVNTHAASRNKITLRVLPSVSDIYLARRYFTPKQVREMLWISVLGTFSLHGPRWKQALKAIVSFLTLPHTLWQIRNRHRRVDDMLKTYPEIPRLENLDS